MRRIVLRLSLALLLVSPVSALFAGGFQKKGSQGVPGEYLVLLQSDVAKLKSEPAKALPSVDRVAARLARRYGGNVQEVWENALTGFLIRMPEKRARLLAGDPRVAWVEENARVNLEDGVLSTAAGDCLDPAATHPFNTRPLPTASPQTILCDDPIPGHDTTGAGQPPRCRDNWGLDRIDQRGGARNGSYVFDRTGHQYPVQTYIFLIDGGIDASHHEFLDAAGHSRVFGGFDAIANCTVGSPSCTADVSDCLPNGHGTHVAGIAGGRTYGVAKDTLLVPVKFGCPGNSYTTYAVRALDWIAGTGARPAVANWSGGNALDYVNDPMIITAAQGVLNAGVLLVQAAGNQSKGYSPQFPNNDKSACDWSLGGHLSGVMVVGGMDDKDARWIRTADDPKLDAYCGISGDCGSNIGVCIDIWAPAAYILSASAKGPDSFCRLSGTSMAAPHVSGAAALYLQAHPTATPAQVFSALVGQGTLNALDNNPSSVTQIGPGSPNLLLYSRVP